MLCAPRRKRNSPHHSEKCFRLPEIELFICLQPGLPYFLPCFDYCLIKFVMYFLEKPFYSFSKGVYCKWLTFIYSNLGILPRTMGFHMRSRGCSFYLKWGVAGTVVLLVLLLGAIAWYNRSLPESSANAELLSDSDLAVLKESTLLRQSLGDRVWPGWDSLQIPLVVYNEHYAFLLGLNDPKEGWESIPYGRNYGTAWEKAAGKPYYRQALPEDGSTPQAFIVRVGDRLAASMTTRDWTEISLVQNIRRQLPGFLRPVFPYQLLVNQFDSDWYISAVLHESFHVVQAKVAYEKLAASEYAASLEAGYPWADAEFRAAWVEERRQLADALREEDPDSLREQVARWIQLRSARRQTLSPEMIGYERQREWLEGLAKYAELSIWKLAGESADYSPSEAVQGVADFHSYDNARKRWDQEVQQLARDLQFDDTQFYYTGWAQAVLLDRLNISWKEKAMQAEVYLDQLFR